MNFHIDITVGDVLVEPLDTLAGHDWLDFASIAGPIVRAISAEQQFAEKLHAYTLPQNPNSRVRDLLDMLLLIQAGTLSQGRMGHVIRATFDKRKTHAVPREFPPPPTSWATPSTVLATECATPDDLERAFHKVRVFFESLPSQ